MSFLLYPSTPGFSSFDQQPALPLSHTEESTLSLSTLVVVIRASTCRSVVCLVTLNFIILF